MTLDPRRYSIAWIAPLPIEARVATCLLDRKHAGRFPMQRGDDYVFQAGEICRHNVVIATLPAGQEYGTGSAAALASQVKKYFPNLWFGLLVGVAAGLPKLPGPSPRDIRLGDILVALPEGESAGLVAYELGKETKEGFHLLKGGHVLAVTETVVRAAIGNIRLQAPDDMDIILPYYDEIKNKKHSGGTFVDPGQEADVLHIVDDSGAFNVQDRDRRPDDRRTRIWYGSIGSGDKLLKHATKRDALRDQYNLIGLEMEAAGTMNRIPVGVIRGVCDYGDEHKNKDWQPYAAAMAGAYAKAVLAQIGPRLSTGGCHIPYRRNRTFTGRESQLGQLNRMLFVEGRERVAIVGLGGIGKTQIALEFAYRVQEMQVDSMEEQCSVFWMPAQSLAAFQQAAMDVAQKLDLHMTDGDDVKEVFREHLASDAAGRWLLVLDNLDDKAVLDGVPEQSNGLGDFLPSSRTGRTLITTRSFQVAAGVAGSDALELDVMTPDDAHAFLRNALGNIYEVGDAKSTRDLLEKLEYLPLTIGQAAAYMRQNRVPIPTYLRHWTSADEYMIDLLSKHLRDETHHSRTQGAVATTWIVSFEAICREDVGAARLLSFIQWIDCKAIPKKMLPVSGSQVDLLGSIGTICGYGFLVWRGDGETLDMHRLAHLALRLWPKQAHERLVTKDHASQHLLQIFPASDWENRQGWRQYLPHVLTLLKEAKLNLDNAMLSLGYKAGMCLQVDGRIREMVQILENVVDVHKETLAETHPDRLATQSQLAVAYRANGQVKEAIKLLEHVVAMCKETLVETHPYQLSSQHELAATYYANGQVKEAITLFKHVVAIRKETLAETHLDRLASQHELAATYHANGQVKEAITLFKHIVACKETLPETHPHRLASQHELAVAYRANGQVKEAIKLFKHVVACNETLPETHPHRLASQHELAATYHANGQVKEAIKLLEHVVACNKTLPETHPRRLASQHELAATYHANGQVKEAIKLLEHVVAIHKETLPETHPDRLTSQHELAVTYWANGQVKEAIEILQHVVAMHKETLAETHPDRLASQYALALALQDAQQVNQEIGKQNQPGRHHRFRWWKNKLPS